MATYKYSAGTVKDVFAWLNRLSSNNEHLTRLKMKYKNAGVEKLRGTVYLVIDDSDRTLAGVEVVPVDCQQETVKIAASREKQPASKSTHRETVLTSA